MLCEDSAMMAMAATKGRPVGAGRLTSKRTASPEERLPRLQKEVSPG
jgi:hypothetical protein